MNMQSEKGHLERGQNILPSTKESVEKAEACEGTSGLKDKENDKEEQIKASATGHEDEPNEVITDWKEDQTQKRGKKYMSDKEISVDGIKKAEPFQQNMTEEMKDCTENNVSTDDIQEAEISSHDKELDEICEKLEEIMLKISKYAERENIDLD